VSKVETINTFSMTCKRNKRWYFHKGEIGHDEDKKVLKIIWKGCYDSILLPFACKLLPFPCKLLKGCYNYTIMERKMHTLKTEDSNLGF
jgi:hypothetical protein